MRQLKKLTFTGLIVVGGALTLAAAPVLVDSVYAGCSGAQCFTDGANAVGDTGGGSDVNAIIKNIVNILLFLLGAIAVVMIIIGGIRYATSNGDSNQITAAKNTILYAVVGLLVAIFAYAIVNFVLDVFTSGGGGDAGGSGSGGGDGAGSGSGGGAGSGNGVE